MPGLLCITVACELHQGFAHALRRETARTAHLLTGLQLSSFWIYSEQSFSQCISAAPIHHQPFSHYLQGEDEPSNNVQP